MQKIWGLRTNLVNFGAYLSQNGRMAAEDELAVYPSPGYDIFIFIFH